jgi:hypothetical protein
MMHLHVKSRKRSKSKAMKTCHGKSQCYPLSIAPFVRQKSQSQAMVCPAKFPICYNDGDCVAWLQNTQHLHVEHIPRL